MRARPDSSTDVGLYGDEARCARPADGYWGRLASRGRPCWNLRLGGSCCEDVEARGPLPRRSVSILSRSEYASDRMSASQSRVSITRPPPSFLYFIVFQV